MKLYYFKGPYKGDSFMVVSQSVEKALEYVKLTIAYSDESESFDTKAWENATVDELPFGTKLIVYNENDVIAFTES